jgi:hypothetical protein
VLSKRLGVGLGEAEAPAIEQIFLSNLFVLPSINLNFVFFFFFFFFKKKSSTIYKILNFTYIKNS